MKIGVDFAEDAKLNKLKLADEAESLSSMLAHYGIKLAEIKAERDHMAHKLSLTESEKEMQYRKFPPAGVDKITESIIKALVTSDPVVIQCQEDLMEVKKELYVLEIAFSTLESKGSMIKVLQALWSNGYFTA